MIDHLEPSLITWSTTEEKVASSEFFGKLAGFQGAVGCIDGCSFILQDRPCDGGHHINRHGQWAVHTVVMCKQDRRIIHCAVGFNGAAHESLTFRGVGPIWFLNLGQFFLI